MAPPELPNHVKKYLQDQGVAESDLTPEALETFSTLSRGEIALLRKLGDSLKEGISTDVVAKVH